jgi:hypothetical protein
MWTSWMRCVLNDGTTRAMTISLSLPPSLPSNPKVCKPAGVLPRPHATLGEFPLVLMARSTSPGAEPGNLTSENGLKAMVVASRG